MPVRTGEPGSSSNRDSELLASLSDALDSPLQALGRATHAIDESSLPPELGDRLLLARESLRRLQDLSGAVGEVLRIEAQDPRLARASFRPALMLQELAAHLTPLAQRRRIRLVQDYAESLPDLIDGDPAALRLLLRNLLHSILARVDSGAVGVWVREGAAATEGLTLEILVGSERRGGEGGEGGDEERTRRADVAAELALALARRLVLRLGGELRIEGEGPHTRYRYRLSVRRVGEAEDSAGGTGPPTQVLCVTETEARNGAWRDQLAQWGIDCRGLVHPDVSPPPIAGSASAGVELLDGIVEELRRARREGKSYDLLLLDARAPSAWCEDLARRLGEDPDLGGTRLGLILGDGMQNEPLKSRLEEAGYAFILTTPVTPEQLWQKIGGEEAGESSDTWILLEEGDEAGSPPPTIVPGKDPAAPAVDPDLGSARLDWEERFDAQILLVDDRPDRRRTHALLLASLGGEVDEADSSFRCFELISTRRYDLVLLDGEMQTLEGFAAVRGIRKREGQARRTPVIAIFQPNSKADNQGALAKDVDDSVLGDSSRDFLAEILRRWLPESKRFLAPID